MAEKKYTDADGLAALLAKIKQKFVNYALLEDLVEVQESLLMTISDVNDKVDSNAANIDTKASKSVVNLLQVTVNGLQTQIDNLKSTLSTDLKNLAAKDEELENNISVMDRTLRSDIDTALGSVIETHDDEMRRLAYHIGLPGYTVTQMMAWKNVAECWGKYKDDARLEIWPRVDMSAVVNAGAFFQGAVNLTKVWPMNTSAMTAAATMFLGCTALREVDAIDLSSCTDMRSMFYQCGALQSVAITGMIEESEIQVRGMFQDCAALKELVLSCFGNTTADADVMFYGCSALERIDIGTLKMAGSLSVGKATQMFAHCKRLYAVYDPIDVGQCTDAALMFQECTKLNVVTLLNIGQTSVVRTWDFSELQYWGDEDRSDDGGQSLLNSMEATCVPWNAVTLKFHADTKMRLENAGLIAKLTEKGFTIA